MKIFANGLYLATIFLICLIVIFFFFRAATCYSDQASTKDYSRAFPTKQLIQCVTQGNRP